MRPASSLPISKSTALHGNAPCFPEDPGVGWGDCQSSLRSPTALGKWSRAITALRSTGWLSVLLFTTGFLVLGLSLYIFVLSLSRPYLGVDIVLQGDSYVVKDIDHLGLAYQAGVKPGDVVVAVDGRPPQEAVNLRRYSRSGFIHQLEVVDNGGEQKLITVEGGSVSRETLLQNVSLFFVGLAFWAVGIFIYARKREDRAALTLYLFSLAMLLSLTTGVSAGQGISGAREAQIIAILLVAPLFLHFFLVFPRDKLLPLTRSRLVYLIYLPATVLLLLYIYTLGGYGEQIYYGWLRSFIMLHLLLGLSLGLLSLLYSFIAADTGRMRQQVKVILVGAILAVLPFVSLSVIPEALTERPLVIPQLSILSAVALPLSMGYAVVKYRLMDVDFYIKRTLVYGTLTLLLITGYILSTMVLSRVLGTAETAVNIIAIALFSVAAIFFLVPTRERIQRAIDRVAYRDRYDYRGTVQQLSSSVCFFRDLDSLAQFIVDSLPRIMGLGGACLLLYDRAGNLTVMRASGNFAEDEESQQEALKWGQRLGQGKSSPQFVPQKSPVEVLVPLKLGEQALGILCLASKISRAEFNKEDFSLLSTFSSQAATSLQNILLLEETKKHAEEIEKTYERLKEHAASLEQSKKELENAYLDIAKTMLMALQARDSYTRGHSERVSLLARRIALELKLSPQEVHRVELAARFHDVGKIGIPDSILLKPGPLSPHEWAQMEVHPIRSVEILRFLGFLQEILPIIEAHHERYDGKGYPYGLEESKIPLGARILAVADAYDAMTSGRPYRSALSTQQTIAALKEGAGIAWDTQVVEAFLRTFAI